jgi:hypothetical protein
MNDKLALPRQTRRNVGKEISRRALRKEITRRECRLSEKQQMRTQMRTESKKK